jgi:hypothetical protein
MKWERGTALWGKDLPHPGARNAAAARHRGGHHRERAAVEEGAVVEEHAAMEATGGKERAAVAGGIHSWLHALLHLGAG